MQKDTFYFTHDYNARGDRKMINLRIKHKMEGVGIYWCLIEMLYENNGKILISDINSISFELKIKEKIIYSIISDFDLFKKDDQNFWSESVTKRLSTRYIKSQKAKESAEARWGSNNKNANALPTQSESNARKERKGNKRKGDESKEEVEEKNHSLVSFFEVFRRSSPKDFSDEMLQMEIGKFKNKYPSATPNSVSLISAWASRMNILDYPKKLTPEEEYNHKVNKAS